MNSKKFVFICGLHRSGTTILSKLLREHYEISGFRNTGSPMDEGQHLQTVFPPAKRYGGPGVFAFDNASYLDEHSNIITPENKNKLFFEWGKHWDLSKPILLEKSPPNIIRTRFLQEMFPNSYFIVIKRHPVAVSLATNAFSGKNIELEKLIEHWILCHKQLEKDLPLLKNTITIKYEELVANPENILHSISNFISCNPIDVALPINSNTNEKYLKKWMGLPATKRADIVNKYERDINAFGYSFKEFFK
ncbi:sulfotransferase [Bacillus cytotoxicus]|uniref:Sulfotransferase n=1 Tax=Bacillus cytotoxicus TaxID=580165 RepID=A0ACC6A2H9_9BACI|nr:sulfotransferase [Bacillus cytotoxicus]